MGCQVTVASEQPLAGFASTHNQGWLQSGALYAGTNQPAVARECRLAADIVASLDPSSVDQERRCFYLFPDKVDGARFAELAAQAGIRCRDPRPVSSIPEISVATQGSPYQCAVEAFDRPFNTRRVLTVVRNELVSLGCSFVHVTSPVGCLGRHAGVWTLVGQTGGYDVVIVAAGAGSPDVLTALGYSVPWGPMWIAVVKVVGLPLESMLLCPQTNMPNVVPFASGLGPGFTVAISKDDRWGFPSQGDVDRAAQRNFGQLLKVLPNIGALSTNPAVVGYYHCTKLAPTSHSTARQSVALEVDRSERLWMFYPGKFTTAPLAARQCARLVVGDPPNAIPVSRQPYP